MPAGGALAVDRERFAALVEARIAAEPRIALHREEVRADSARPAARSSPAVRCRARVPGEPRCRAALGSDTRRRRELPRLHYYDAASPIVAADSIDESPMYRKSRYDKGDGDDYLNIPLDRDGSTRLVSPICARSTAIRPRISKRRDYFEGCLPIEEMADRGDDVLRFGPLKPVGLRDPRTGKTPYAVVQLRKENVEGTAFNLVGFQTRLTWPAQREAFGKLPGPADAEWLRLGVMHRNTFIDSPRLLDAHLRLRGTQALYFAGQITGAEGYVEAAACGAMAGIHAARAILRSARRSSSRARPRSARSSRTCRTARHHGLPAGERHLGLFPPTCASVATSGSARASHGRARARSRSTAWPLKPSLAAVGVITLA